MRAAQTTFSQRGVQERGDTRGWTETPQQKLLRLSAAEQQRAPALEAAAAQQNPAAAEAVDAYNDAHRAKTLVQKHQEKLKAGLLLRSLWVKTTAYYPRRACIHICALVHDSLSRVVARAWHSQRARRAACSAVHFGWGATMDMRRMLGKRVWGTTSGCSRVCTAALHLRSRF